MKSSQKVWGMISEEDEDMTYGDASSKYIVTFDPLDGSTNIEVNMTIGSIFCIFRKKKEE